MRKLLFILSFVILGHSLVWAQSGDKSVKSVFAHFNYVVDTISTGGFVTNFTDNSTGNVITYLWEFGDGETSTEQNPTHIYAVPGLYEVTLTIVVKTDNLLYQDREVKRVSVAERGFYHMGGHVFAGLFPTDEGYACLYKVEIINDEEIITAIDTAYFNQLGFYYFYQQEGGNYFVKIDIPETSENAETYLPTYYGNNLMWTDAQEIEFNQTYWQYDIHLLESTDIDNGIGNITGNIIYNDAVNYGQIANNIPIILINSEDGSKICKYSNEEGVFEFHDIELGSYQVHAEVTGKITEPHFTFLSENNPNVGEIGIIITNDEVISLVGEEENDSNLNYLNIYPNPSYGNINIRLEETNDISYTAYVYTLSGQLITNHQFDVSKGLNKINLSLGDLPRGTYILNFSAPNRLIQNQKLIIH